MFIQKIALLGWHIHPANYGDYDPHFYVRWTNVGSKKSVGCCNLDCQGFVLHRSAKYIPDAKIWLLFKYGGDQKYIDIKLYKDSSSGDWWLYEGVDNYENPVGYFKKEIFDNFDKAWRFVEATIYLWVVDIGIIKEIRRQSNLITSF